MVDPNIRAKDMLAKMWSTLTLVKNTTNFTLMKFEELAFWIVLMISSHIKSTSEPSCQDLNLIFRFKIF
jgi:hypothetical protein